MTIRTPKAWLKLDSGLVNCTHVEVELTRYATADSFMAKMAMDDSSSPGPAFWEDTAPIPAGIIANNGDGSTGDILMIFGAIDIVEVDWDTREVTVHGSDKVRLLVDTRSDQHFPNMKAEDIVAQIASKHGLTPNFDVESDFAGKTYDGQNYAFNSDRENEWDVVQSLAKQAGKLAYIKGDNLYFVSPGSNSGGTYTVIYKPPPQPSLLGGKYGYMTLRTWRNITLDTIEAKTSSWHPHEKQAFTTDGSAPDPSAGEVDKSLPGDFGAGF